MFQDRNQAGEALADRLSTLNLRDPLVLALPRGGVPVAVPVARRLAAPLDLALVRKIGAPGHEELAVGAIMVGAAGEDIAFNPAVLRMLGMVPEDFAETVQTKRDEIARRQTLYLGGAAPAPIEGRSVILVDDGIATGATMRAALLGVRRMQPLTVVLAVPLAPEDSLAELRGLADTVLCLQTPSPFYAVGQHYRRFDQVSDGEVVELLRKHRDWLATHKRGGRMPH